VKASRLATPLLVGATLILLGANALPTALRKHRLIDEKRRVTLELHEQVERGERLAAQREAMRGDAFYIQRVTVETWKGVPPGAIRWTPEAPRDRD